jgi:hypothetical protein
LVRLCEVGKDEPVPQEQSKFFGDLSAQYREGNSGFIDCSASGECPNFPMPHLLKQIDNPQGATVHSVLHAMASDFGEFAFSNTQQVDMKTREVLAAGWRNIWNIAGMLEVK